MDENELLKLFNDIKSDKLSINEAIKALKSLPFKDLDYAKLDTHRKIRQGFSEAVYCPGKTVDQIKTIMQELKTENNIVLATRANPESAEEILKQIEDSYYDKEARMIIMGSFPEKLTKNYALVITAGTSDIPVAKEAIITLKTNGIRTETIFDCGIAGAHRLFSYIDNIQNAKAIIVVAGMEGALASLVGGLSPCPVVAVPTSQGYGANFSGLSALLAMLNSCTSCVSVVNIDNGYGAGIIASLIVRQSESFNS